MRTILGSKNTNQLKKTKRANKRSRKTLQQIQLLEVEFAHNPDWGKDDISRIACKAALTEAQVYKWGWDQKQKLQFSLYSKLKLAPSLSQLFDGEMPAPGLALSQCQPEDPSCETLRCSEVLFPFVVDKEIMKLHNKYRESMEWLSV